MPPNAPGLIVEGLGKTWRKASRPVFSDLAFALGPTDRLAVLGRNGQGKSTLIKILGGVLPASTGRVNWGMTASWPIGFGGGFQGSLSGLDNIRFLARLYDRNFTELRDRVDDFAELGHQLTGPVKHYSSGMRARLAFGLSLAIEFDCYLIDELVAVGDARFQQKCQEELFAQRADRAFIMASHDVHLIGAHCRKALVIEGGKAKLFDDVHEAVEIYTWLRAA
ncbi:ABC transporter ATP-binding protein [uncultured Brevundimonas sp.]|uniref:ABC transporter ATP-binding protein n=1 Tax=uncultured Brevundimonas sp. TaxID=213418 RepID=UPI0030EB8A7F|tara:strand:- start:754 stop:1422 length:669 start_codon:yes stop_codon:yes gene_type:complete